MVSVNGRESDGGARLPVFDLHKEGQIAGGWLAGPDPTRPWHQHYPDGVSPRLSYPQESLGWLLQHAAGRFPERIACHYYSESLTYLDLLSQAEGLASTLLREGLKPGDRVAVLLPNLPETVVSLFAIWLAGGVAVSLSPLMVSCEIDALLKATNARIAVTLDVLSPLICQGDYVPELVIHSSLRGRLRQLERLGYAWVRFQKIGFGSVCSQTRVLQFSEAIENTGRSGLKGAGVHDPAFILPTGGTTGKPKAVTLSHFNLMAQAFQLSHWSLRPQGTETVLAVLPFFHSYGLSTCLMMGMALGATLVLHHRFRPRSVVHLIETHRPTIFLAVPAMLSQLNHKLLRKGKYDLSSLQIVMSGGAALSADVAEEFQTHTGAEIVEGYGLSEASPVTHVGPLDGTAVVGTIGLPISDTDARIVDNLTRTEILPANSVGELLVRGPQVMLGYWDDPAATNDVLRDGWLHTGDLGCHDERGFFKIVGRKKDLIITSGFNVYPQDVESALRNYPGVKDAAVVGVPDADKGELVKAVLVVDSAKRFRRRDFDEYVKSHLAAHKRPRVVELREEDLPRNFLGKVLRRKLREDDESDRKERMLPRGIEIS